MNGRPVMRGCCACREGLHPMDMPRLSQANMEVPQSHPPNLCQELDKGDLGFRHPGALLLPGSGLHLQQTCWFPQAPILPTCLG